MFEANGIRFNLQLRKRKALLEIWEARCFRLGRSKVDLKEKLIAPLAAAVLGMLPKASFGWFRSIGSPAIRSITDVSECTIQGFGLVCLASFRNWKRNFKGRKASQCYFKKNLSTAIAFPMMNWTLPFQARKKNYRKRFGAKLNWWGIDRIVSRRFFVWIFWVVILGVLIWLYSFSDSEGDFSPRRKVVKQLLE